MKQFEDSSKEGITKLKIDEELIDDDDIDLDLEGMNIDDNIDTTVIL